MKILLGLTGSVATIKCYQLIEKLQAQNHEIKVIYTQTARHFFDLEKLPTNVTSFSDADEYSVWSSRGDPVLHIDLSKWCDILLIAPVSANTLAKISHGLCDNLLTCVARTFDFNDKSKKFIVCPAMNTKMYQHPITSQQLDILKNWGVQVIAVVSKTLICGDTGLGAMAELDDIVQACS